jgi:hypothetical protein
MLRLGVHIGVDHGKRVQSSCTMYFVLQAVDANEDRRFHVLITAEGSATHWQCRLHYYW